MTAGLLAAGEPGWAAWNEGGARDEERAGQGGFLGVDFGGARLRFPWGAELPLEREAMRREVERHWAGGGRVRAQTWLLHIEVLSRTPEGAPVRTDGASVAPGEVDAALAMAREEIEAVTEAERLFQQRFERAARDLTAEMLAGSEATVRGSLAGYGIELGPVLEKAIEKEGRAAGEIALDVLDNPLGPLGQAMVASDPALHAGAESETASRADLAAAVQDLRARAAELAEANAENDRLQVEVQRRRGGVCYTSHHRARSDRPDFSHLAAFPAPEVTFHGHRVPPADEAGLDVQATGSARRVERLTGELHDAWRGHEARHPVLAAYRDRGGYPTDEFGRLAGGGEERHRELVRVSFERLCAVAKARQGVTSGAVSVLELPRVVAQTRARLGVEPGSVQDAFIGNAVADASDPDWLAWVVTALSFASAILLAPATAGSSAALALDVGLFTADIWFAIDAAAKDTFATAAALTDYDPDRALGDEDDASAAPLVAALVAAGLGGLQIVRHVSASGRRAGTAMAGDSTHLGPPHLLALTADGAEAAASYPRVVRLSSQSWVDAVAATPGGPETLALLDSLLALEEAGRVRGAAVWLARAEQRGAAAAVDGLDGLREAHRLATAHPSRVVKLGMHGPELVPIKTREEYMAIDSSDQPSGWWIREQERRNLDGSQSCRTVVTGPNGAEGELKRTYRHRESSFEMNEVFFDDELPRSIAARHATEMRTVTYLTARQMRLMGVEYGTLKTVKMSTIQNVVAVCQLDWLLRKGMPIDEAVLRTHSVEYAEGVIDLSGHRIVGARVVGGTRADFDSGMLRFYETERFSTVPDPDIVARHDRILASYGVRRTDPVLWDYDIYLDLMPVSSGGKR